MEETQEQISERANKVLNEKDPFLREIWAHGYDEVIESCGQYILCRKIDKYTKQVSHHAFSNCLFTLKHSVLIDGTPYSWISEADGSADRFREIIKPEHGGCRM